MLEIRKIKTIEVIEEGDNRIKITWDIFRDEEYSHSYEQYYANTSIEQFFLDVGNEVAIPYIKYFDIKF